jgi:hypothetical protein
MRTLILILLTASLCRAQEINVSPMAVAKTPVVASVSPQLTDSLYAFFAFEEADGNYRRDSVAGWYFGSYDAGFAYRQTGKVGYGNAGNTANVMQIYGNECDATLADGCSFSAPYFATGGNLSMSFWLKLTTSSPQGECVQFSGRFSVSTGGTILSGSMRNLANDTWNMVGYTHGWTEDDSLHVNTWYMVSLWYNATTDSIYMALNDNAPIGWPCPDRTLSSVYAFRVGQSGVVIDQLRLWRGHALTEADRVYLWNVGDGR